MREENKIKVLEISIRDSTTFIEKKNEIKPNNWSRENKIIISDLKIPLVEIIFGFNI